MNFRTLGLIALLAILFFITIRVLADVKAERIKLKLDDVCFEKVEEVAETIEGVMETHWDEETGELEIIYEQDKTNLLKIEKAISEAGYDTPRYKAPEEAAAKVLDSCKEKESDGL